MSFNAMLWTLKRTQRRHLWYFSQEGKQLRLKSETVIWRTATMYSLVSLNKTFLIWNSVSAIKDQSTTRDIPAGNFPWVPMRKQMHLIAVSEARCPRPQDPAGMYKAWRYRHSHPKQQTVCLSVSLKSWVWAVGVLALGKYSSSLS